ncbi:Protein of unknown function [Propionibacterium freudenreichii]|nr:Protein of unknown function [Propionibacterium freudenreichii]
MKLRRFFGPTT